MPALTDVVTLANLRSGATAGDLAVLTNDARNLYVKTSDGWEPANGVISAWCVGTGAIATFTIGTLPANCLVNKVEVIVSGTAGTATTTLAVGISGTTGKYMTASHFSSSMNAAGVKTVTTIPIHETATRTVIATFSASWDSGAKALVAVQYVKLPAVPA